MSIKSDLRNATIRHAVRVAVNDLERSQKVSAFWRQLAEAASKTELRRDLARWEDDGGR